MDGLHPEQLLPEEIQMLINGTPDEQSVDRESADCLQDTGEKVAVHLAQLPSFEEERVDPKKEKNEIELLSDVSILFSVELGRTEKTLKDVLDLGPGSVIELEKSAGEPLDILINGRLVAKGEVIVIDETYGIRIKGFLNNKEAK